jgi:multidrug efflux pump subunit AcrA (membrane-fusion protein)
MPRQIYDEIKQIGVSTPQRYDECSVLMLDFVGFTELSVSHEPSALVAELNDIFTAFDRIAEPFGCERIKTLGDAYIAVCGLPEPAPDHAVSIARVAQEQGAEVVLGAMCPLVGEEAARAVVEIADGQRPSDEQPTLDLYAPIDGMVLRRHRWSEGTVAAGERVLEIGDLSRMEVLVDLLSMDATRVEAGMRVELVRWGGEETLEGRVRRVEPSGFTRISALGVEEQRVPVWIEFASPQGDWASLGDGFRIEARFILWEGEGIVQIPTSALFREADAWHVFVVDNGRAHLRQVETGRRSSLWTQISDGLETGEIVITHPGDRIGDGTRVQADLRMYR